MSGIILEQISSPGGPILLALIAVSIAATAVTIFKIVQFAQMHVGRTRRLREALAQWEAGNHSTARQELRKIASPSAEVALTVIRSFDMAPAATERAREIGTQAALTLLSDMSRFMRVIEAIVQAAPMLGLLGTVIGMIDAFGVLSAQGGAIDPSALAGGIWVALITTAAGLTIAIPFYFIAIWLEGRIEGERADMETAIAAVLFGAPQVASAQTPMAGGERAMPYAAGGQPARL